MEQNTPTPVAPTPTVVKSDNPQKRPVNKTLILVVGLIILTLVLLAITLTVKRSSLPSLSKDDAKNMQDIAHTTLTVSSDVQTASAAGTYQTDINVEPNGNKVTGVQLELSYDPKVITVTDIKPGSFFPKPTVLDKVIDTAAGKAILTVGTSFGADAITDNGQVAILTFKKTGEGNVVINILPTSLVTDSRYRQSVLNSAVSADIETLPSSGSSNTTAVPTTASTLIP